MVHVTNNSVVFPRNQTKQINVNRHEVKKNDIHKILYQIIKIIKQVN